MLVWRDEGSIPAAGEKFLYLKIKEKIGYPIIVRAINLENNTRPKSDPRPCFAWVGSPEDPHGDSGTSGLFIAGYACSYGNLHTHGLRLRLNMDHQIGFKFLGEQNDEVKASVIYEEV